MKLQTSIIPRRDGTVRVLGDDGETYVFTADEGGVLTAEIPHEPTVARLLLLGTFMPFDEADFEHAGELAAQAEGTDEDADQDDDDDDEVGLNALPVEANTPPAPKPKRAGKKQ